MNKIQDLWKFAYAAYDYPTGKEDLFSDSLDFVRFDLDKNFCYIARFKERIIICFRGTKAFKSRRGFRAWRQNFEVFPMLGPNDTIHNGFYDAWNTFKKPINQYINKILNIESLPFPKIEVTGHSKGSTLATLCCRHLAKNRRLPCSGIVFGTPRVGNKEFRNEFNILPINFTRVNLGYDIVKYVPPALWTFRHVGKSYWLKQPFWHKYFMKVHNHFPSNYNKKIQLLK